MTQTCVYPDVCLGIAHVSGKVPSLGTRGLVDTQCICPFRPTDSLGRKGQIHCVSTRPLVPREGLYQIHGQSLNTHRGKHRSGGAQSSRETPFREWDFAFRESLLISESCSENTPELSQSSWAVAVLEWSCSTSVVENAHQAAD